MLHGRLFFEAYISSQVSVDFKIVEIGSQNVNGSLREVCPSPVNYIGLDFAQGEGVDVVLNDPYKLPFDSETVDAIVCSSCFEHSEFFWLVFLEALRILKPNGLFYLNAPSNGFFHRWPVDCWRFYPDSANALVHWAERNGMQPVALESFIGDRSAGTVAQGGMWNDFVAVFLKDRTKLHLHPRRILHSLQNYSNGLIHGSDQTLRFNEREADFSLIQSQLEQLNSYAQALEAAKLETAAAEKRKAELELALRELVDSDAKREAQLDRIFAMVRATNESIATLAKATNESIATLAKATNESTATLAKATNESTATLAKVNHEKQVMERLLAETKASLKSANREIQDMQTSRSWRLTSPYRWLGSKLRRLR